MIYDACVLYPAPLRDVLMHLALTDMFNARWTNRIHEEWIRNVLKNRPDLTREQLERTRDLMDSKVREPKVENYEALIPTLHNLPDPDDAHVLAAAIKTGADAIVTFNLKDFPASVLSQYHIEVIHPDDFIQYQIDLDTAKVCNAIKRLRAGLKRPPMTVEQYLVILKKQSLPQSVLTLAGFSELL